ncbi:ComF family protein [Spirosoma sp.]|uniref:ComF family protein n=1 Tax=Spirosoma sp. TaxID=1899569 RepID=UPI003B3A6660
MFQFIQHCISDFIDLLFPDLCVGCDQLLNTSEKYICSHCRMNLPETGHHREPYDQILLNKFAGKVPIQFIASYVYFTKGSSVQKIIHQIKYKGQKEAAKEIARWYGYLLKSESKAVEAIDVVISVPLHKSRLQQRGYNQADWIAEGLAEALEIPVCKDVVIRNQFKESQTNKNRLERWENVKSAFSVLNSESVLDKHVAIVDDVLTTGATIEACATELLKAGCRSVSVLTLAVAGR